MPGVPSSRGCDACRKQKKKCDPTKVPCPRCSRLKIECTGSGQRRFIFKNHTSEKNLEIPAKSSRLSSTSRESSIIDIGIPRDLSNSHTLLVSNLISKLHPDTDIKFQLLWNFGPYLQEIPKYLGQSEALDATVDCLLETYSNFLNGCLAPTREVLMKHSEALHALTRSLNDVTTARSTETLCAVMLLLVQRSLQDWACSSAPKDVSHGRGAAQIIKARGNRPPSSDFEQKLLATLRGPVVFEAVLNGNINFTQEQWQSLVLNGAKDTDSPDGQLMVYFAKIADFLQRGHNLKTDGCYFFELLDDVTTAFNEFEAILSIYRERLSPDLTDVAPEYGIGSKYILYGYFTRMYGLGLTGAIILGCILDSLDGSGGVIRYKVSTMSEEILKLAPLVAQYRPLASMYFIICLGVAWAGAADDKSQKALREWLGEFHSDFSQMGPHIPPGYLEQLAERFTIRIAPEPTILSYCDMVEYEDYT